MTSQTSIPSYQQLVQYIRHSENQALYGEGVLLNLSPGQLLVRVEAFSDKRAGNWFYGPFNDLDHSRNYAKYIAKKGRKGIRQISALPHIWPDGVDGNAIDVVRIYRVINATPAISSVVAPQDETGTVMATSEQIAAVRAGTYAHEPKYKGEGHQLSVPVADSGRLHNHQLVQRLPGEETPIAVL